MKIALLLFFITSSIVSFSQLTILERTSTIDYASDTLVLNVSQASKEYSDYGFISIYFDISNAISTKDLIVTRKIISTPLEWSDLVCWGIGCYDPMGQNVFTTPLPGVTCEADGTTYELKPEIDPNDVVGTGHYRYYLVDVNDNNNFVDSVDLLFNFGIANVVNIDKSITFSVSPNPASDHILINVDNNVEMDFKVVDVLGNVIDKDVMNSSKKLDVSHYKNGLYFITLSSKDKSMVTRKMIVKH